MRCPKCGSIYLENGAKMYKCLDCFRSFKKEEVKI